MSDLCIITIQRVYSNNRTKARAQNLPDNWLLSRDIESPLPGLVSASLLPPPPQADRDADALKNLVYNGVAEKKRVYVTYPLGKTNVALIFPHDIQSYRIDLPATATKGGGPLRVEFEFNVHNGKSFPNGEYAIYARPVKARVLRGGSVIKEVNFSSTAVATGPRTEGPTTSLAVPVIFGPELADLLAVKYRPDLVNQQYYWRMLLARRAYERAASAPQFGRFFNEIQIASPQPNPDLLRPQLPAFEKWTRERAAALPAKVTVDEFFSPNAGVLSSSQCLTTPFGEAMHNVDLENARRSNVASCMRAASTDCVMARERQRDACEGDTVHPDCRPIDLKACTAKHAARCGQVAGRNSEPTSYRYAISYSHCGLGAKLGLAMRPSADHIRIDGIVPSPDKNAAWMRSLPHGAVVRRELDVVVKKVEGSSGGGFQFDVALTDVRFLDAKTGTLLATLTTPPPTTAQPESSTSQGSDLQAQQSVIPVEHGPDILGIKIGMTFAAAEKIIRANMNVGTILVEDRKWQTSAAVGDLKVFTSARLFLSRDGNNVIILYDEPPAVSGVVLGVVREVRLPKGSVPTTAIFAKLRAKYGPESAILDSASPSPTLLWNDKDAFITGPDKGCLPFYTFSPNPIWRTVAGKVPNAQQIASRDIAGFPSLQGGTGTGCPLVVGAMLKQGINTWDDLDTWLVDGRAYGKAFAASKALLKKAPAAAAKMLH